MGPLSILFPHVYTDNIYNAGDKCILSTSSNSILNRKKNFYSKMHASIEKIVPFFSCIT